MAGRDDQSNCKKEVSQERTVGGEGRGLKKKGREETPQGWGGGRKRRGTFNEVRRSAKSNRFREREVVN